MPDHTPQSSGAGQAFHSGSTEQTAQVPTYTIIQADGLYPVQFSDLFTYVSIAG